jgi:hypothetical protein
MEAYHTKYIVDSRDKTIALSRMAHLILGVTFPCFDPNSTKEKKDMFIKKAIDFLSE